VDFHSPLSHVATPLGARSCKLLCSRKSMTLAPSPCLCSRATQGPPHKLSWRLKSPATSISSLGFVVFSLLTILWISCMRPTSWCSSSSVLGCYTECRPMPQECCGLLSVRLSSWCRYYQLVFVYIRCLCVPECMI
jgi:hypothetical protein